MQLDLLIAGVIGYLYLLILLTFHEFAHAWTALKCGDDTALRLGRVSLNPAVHVDMLGTVILPMVFILMGAMGAGGGFFFGWAKPVPFNPARLRSPRVDSVLIALAGPAMNLLLAAAILPLARLGYAVNSEMLVQFAVQMADISLILCFFNLLPIPPLDGSHVLRYLTGMSDMTYYKLAQVGFFLVILVIQIPIVRAVMNGARFGTLALLANLYGVR